MADNLSLSVILSAIDRLSGPFKKSEEAIKRLNRVAAQARDLERFGTGLSLSGAFATGAASQMIRAVGAMSAPLIALDSAAAKVSSMPGIADDAVARIVAAGRRWSKEHVATADQFVDTSYIMLSAGLNEAQAIAATRAGLSLATAAIGENADAANLLAVIYNNMGDKSRDATAEMGRLADVVARTQQVFQLKDLTQLSEGLKMATPAAIGARVELAQLTAAVGQLNSAGVQGAIAGTTFAALLRQLIPASRALGFQLARSADGGLDLIGTLESMQARFGDLAKLTDGQRLALQKAFGDEGQRGVTLLLSNLDALRGNLNAVRESTGAVTAAQSKLEKSAANQMQIANNNLAEFKTIFASQLLPTITAALPKVVFLLETFGKFAEAHPGIIKIAGGVFLVGTALLAVFGPILAVVGGFSLFAAKAMGAAGAVMVIGKAMSFLAAVIMVNPIGAAVAALAVGAFLIIKNWDTVKAWFANFIEWIGDKFASLVNLLPDWLINLPSKLAGAQSALARPTLQTVGRGQTSTTVGGEIRLKIETESGSRARVLGLRSNNRNVPIDVDNGPMMVTP